RRINVVATGPLGQIQLSLFFGIISVDVYKQIIRTLGAGGYTDQVYVDSTSVRYAEDHFTCHSFWYDWRKEGGELELHRARELEAWLARGFRFDIVAHSMGGLIARYYLRYGAEDLPADGSEPTVTWAGAKEVDQLIMVGTPNLGSMEALKQLTQGYEPSFLLPFYDPAVLGSMPSIYQLLPRVRHKLVLDGRGKPLALDFMDPQVWLDNRWGLFDPAYAETLSWLLPDAKTRAATARQYLESSLGRARAFHRAMDKAPEQSCPAEIYLFAADSEPTLARISLRRTVNGRESRLVPSFEIDARTTRHGDGTVARYSALADEREGGPYRVGVRSTIPWTGETFLSDDHIGLTKNPHFSNNLLHLLLERPLPTR
ncbi:MAG: hypothetical protein DRI90_28410, partial [Deltaproteobacteria bacterium]